LLCFFGFLAAVQNMSQPASQQRNNPWWAFWTMKHFNPPLSNPGKYEEVDKAKEVLFRPDTFEGFKFDFLRAVHEKFAITHSFQLGHRGPETSIYTFSAQYAYQNKPNDLVMLAGRMDTDKAAFARAERVYPLTRNVTLDAKLGVQVSLKEEDASGLELEMGLRTKSGSHLLKAHSSGGYNLTWLQAITPTISIGADYVRHITQGFNILGGQIAYRKAPYGFSLSANSMGTGTLSYWHEVGKSGLPPQATSMVGAILEVGRTQASPELESTTAVGWQYVLTASRLRGQFDSKYKLRSHYEFFVLPTLSVILSGEVDYRKGDSKFGVGLNLTL